MPQSGIYRRPPDELAETNSPAQAPYPQARMATSQEVQSSGIGAQPSVGQQRSNEIVGNAAQRNRQRSAGVETRGQQFFTSAVNAADSAQAGVRGLLARGGGAMLNVADDAVRAGRLDNTGFLGNRGSTRAPAPNSPAPAPNSPAASRPQNNMTPDQFQRLLNPPNLPQNGAIASVAAPTQQASTSQRVTVPGAEGYMINHGGGNNEAARAGVMASADRRGALGMQNAQAALNAERRAARPQGGGMDPQLQQRLSAIGTQREALQQQIQHGMTTNRRGQRLTSAGLQGLTSQLNALGRMESDLVGGVMQNDRQAATDQSAMQRQMLANQGQMDVAGLQGQNQLAGIEARVNDPFNQARAEYTRRQAESMGLNVQPPQMPNLAHITDQGQAAQVFEQYQLQSDGFNNAVSLLGQTGGDFDAAMQELMETRGELPEGDPMLARLEATIQQLNSIRVQNTSPAGYAQGGLVGQHMDDQQMMNIQRFAEGGLVGEMMPPEGGMEMGMPGAEMSGTGAPPASIQQYQQYVQMARQMGIEPVGFDEFAQMTMQQAMPPGQPPMPEMQQGAMGNQQVMGMADGGMVPDMMGGSAIGMPGPQVDGAMVMDPDPNAPTDSIPAMIDGQQPAALDSGEFVIPADVVMHFGTDKLKKMIEQARGAGRE